MQNLEDLLVNAANKKDYSANVQAVINFYGDDFDESELSTQLQIFTSSFYPWSSLFSSTVVYGPMDVFKQVYWVAHLILALLSARERALSISILVHYYGSIEIESP